MQLYAVCEPWMSSLGVWPMKKFNWVFKIYVFLSVGYLLIPEIVFLSKNYKNVDEFGACFCEMMVVVQGLYKLMILIYHKRNWSNVISSILKIFREYKHFSDAERKWILRLQFFIGIYMKLFIVTGFVYITSPNMFAGLQYAMSKNVTLTPETAKLDFVFFDLKESPSGYATYTFLNITTVVYIALVCSATDVLYLSTIYFCIFYLERITERLSEQKVTYEGLCEFAINHKNIVRTLKRIQKLSKTFMMIQYFSILSMTCFIGLVLTTVPQTTDSLINFTLFIVTVQLQMIAYSFIGERLMSCSLEVNRTLWNLNWYEQPIGLQKMIQFIMLQSQNNKIALSASSVINIGYESYLKYVKISFQILCLLQSFYV